MNTPTYKEQFDKITRAYVDNEMDPLMECACFIGNLLNTDEWAICRTFKAIEFPYRKGTTFVESDITCPIPANEHWIKEKVLHLSQGLYSADDIIRLENNFLTVWLNGNETEDALFHAMESTLEMLKQIHIRKGEHVEEIPFTKRQPVLQ
jgi:hypothetical protein